MSEHASCEHCWRLFAIWWGSKFFWCYKCDEVREDEVRA